MLKRVDITRGPTATIYGSGAIGGVAAFEIIDATDILKAGETAGVRLTGRYSSNGQGLFGSSAAAMRIGNFDIVGQLNGREVGDYNDGNGARIVNSGEDTTSGLIKFRMGSDNGHRITGTIIAYDSNFIDSAVTGSSPRDTDVTNRQYNIGYTYTPSDNPFWALSAKIYRNETELFQKNLAAPVGAIRFFNVETEGFDVSNSSRFTFDQVKVKFTYGFDGFRDTVNTFDPTSNGDELTPGGVRQVGGAFIQSWITWGIVDLIGAARYDTYSIEGGTTSLEGERISPKGTVGVTPFKGVTFFATYAEGYRAPAITETLIRGFHPAPFSFTLLPNPNLLPEVAHNVEGGVNLKFKDVLTTGDALQGKITVFENKVEDYISGVYSATPPPFGRYQYQNIANVTIDGVEVEAVYDARRWFLGLGAHRIRGADDLTGQPLLTIPADQLTVTAGFRAFENALMVGGRARFVAAQDRVPTGTAPVDGYSILDLFAHYKVNEALSLNLNVDNVFDRAYLQYLDQTNSPGMNARVGMTWRFGG
jgi:hemoglobin/transferrin/lactoferrin receptor protein